MNIHKTNTSVFLELPAGKPNPNKSYSTGSQRERVQQCAQKGLTCWYYALNAIRQRPGPNCPSELKEKRAFEEKASNWRKRQTEIDAKQQFEGDNALGIKLHAKTKKEIETLLPCITDEKVCQFVIAFLKQKEIADIYDYANDLYAKATQENARAFLEKLHFPFDRHPLNRTAELTNTCFQQCVHYYGLHISGWKPSHPINVLTTLLGEQGPHVIKGFFGKIQYEKPPEPLKKLHNYQVLCWKGITDEHFTNHKMTHSIIIIGTEEDAKAKGGGVVYFLDPMDPSDPQHPHDRPVYTMSYERLRKNIVTYTGALTGTLEERVRGTFPEHVPYAVCNLHFREQI